MTNSQIPRLPAQAVSGTDLGFEQAVGVAAELAWAENVRHLGAGCVVLVMTPIKNATIAVFLCLSAAGTAIAGPDGKTNEPVVAEMAIPSVGIEAAAIENRRPDAPDGVEIIDRLEGWNQQTVLAQVTKSNAEPQLWIVSMTRGCSRSPWRATNAVDLSSLVTWFKQRV